MHSTSAGTNTESSFLRILNTSIAVPSFEKDALIDLASAHIAKLRGVTVESVRLSGDTARMCATYLRHKHSPYESLLGSRKWKNQNRDTYILVFKRVMDAIAKSNPWLAETCQQEYEEKTGAAFTLRKHVRLIKGGGLLTREHIEEHNKREHEAFSGIADEYEPSGYIGEDDGTFRVPLTSLASIRLLYLPPFLRRDEIRARRFTDIHGEMNDRWWEWEQEKGMAIPEREPRFHWRT